MNLRLKNISKSFDNKLISDFSYTFDDDGLYFIVGESGIGKTTLLRIIAGLDTKYSGEVENGGISRTSFMFQEYRLFPTLSAIKNAALTQKAEHMAKELLCDLGFKPDDLKKKPRELSGGMKQRVAFVRALLKDAPILILDEPTKELDADTASIMLDMIVKESKKRLVIVVTHDNILNSVDESRVIRF